MLPFFTNHSPLPYPIFANPAQICQVELWINTLLKLIFASVFSAEMTYTPKLN